jgi:hypothetical protein
MRSMSGNENAAPAPVTDWLLSGRDARQQSSAFAVGAHLPFKQHFAVSLGELPNARQSSGLISRTIAITLTAI